MKNIFKTGLMVFLLSYLLTSCENTANDGDEDGGERLRTGRVTFFNESSYQVKVHRDAFSGPVIVELNAGQSRPVDVRVSDTHGYGTTFSIEYLYRINDAFDADSGDIFASGLDFNVQINRVIEEGKSYTIQIPQPTDLEFRTAFIKLLNAHNLPIELRYVGMTLRQAGNNTIPISPGRTGVYRFSDIPPGGELVYRGYRVVSTMASTDIPDFTARNGVIYSFTFNGSSVVLTGQQTIVFK